MWAYRDDSVGGAGLSVPGPTIQARVGDTLIVHFTNNLPEATTVHWHGVEVPATMDGSHISQRHVYPGETFVYQFPLLREGLYWYHPHVRPFDQVEQGLYGCLLVKDPAREDVVFANLGGRAIEEHIVVFDDVLLDANHEVVPAFSFSDPLQNALYQLNGRVGNHLLVNGRQASTVNLDVTNGAIQRWHCLNAANTSFARLDIHATTTSTFQSLGADTLGAGCRRGLQRQALPALPQHPDRSECRRRRWSRAPGTGAGQRDAPGHPVDARATHAGRVHADRTDRDDRANPAERLVSRPAHRDATRWSGDRDHAAGRPDGRVLSGPGLLPDDPAGAQRGAHSVGFRTSRCLCPPGLRRSVLYQ